MVRGGLVPTIVGPTVLRDFFNPLIEHGSDIFLLWRRDMDLVGECGDVCRGTVRECNGFPGPCVFLVEVCDVIIIVIIIIIIIVFIGTIQTWGRDSGGGSGGGGGGGGGGGSDGGSDGGVIGCGGAWGVLWRPFFLGDVMGPESGEVHHHGRDTVVDDSCGVDAMLLVVGVDLSVCWVILLIPHTNLNNHFRVVTCPCG